MPEADDNSSEDGQQPRKSLSHQEERKQLQHNTTICSISCNGVDHDMEDDCIASNKPIDDVLSTPPVPNGLQRQQIIGTFEDRPGAFAVSRPGHGVPSHDDDSFHEEEEDTTMTAIDQTSDPNFFFSVKAELVEESGEHNVESSVHRNVNFDVEEATCSPNSPSSIILVKAQPIESKRSGWFQRRHLIAYLLFLILCIIVTIALTKMSDNEHLEREEAADEEFKERLDAISQLPSEPLNRTQHLP